MKTTRVNLVLMFILVFTLLSSLASAELLNLKTESKNYTKEYIENNSLFDIFITIPQSFEKVEQGEELLTNVKLINLGSGGRIDVLMNYEIKDSSGKSLLAKKETVAVETQANFVRTFDIPADALPGKYNVYVRLVYADGREAATDASFEIVKPSSQKTKDYLIYLLIGIVVLVIFIYLAIKSRIIIDRIKMKLQIRRIIRKKLG